MRVLVVVMILAVSRLAAAEPELYFESMVLGGGNGNGRLGSFRTSLGLAMRHRCVEVRAGGLHELAALGVPFQGSTDRFVLPGAGGFLEIGRSFENQVLAGHLSLASFGGARGQDGPARVALGLRYRRDALVLAADAIWQTAPGKGLGVQVGIGVTPRSGWGKLGSGVLLAGAVVAGFVASYAANTH